MRVSQSLDSSSLQSRCFCVAMCGSHCRRCGRERSPPQRRLVDPRPPHTGSATAVQKLQSPQGSIHCNEIHPGRIPSTLYKSSRSPKSLRIRLNVAFGAFEKISTPYPLQVGPNITPALKVCLSPVHRFTWPTRLPRLSFLPGSSPCKSVFTATASTVPNKSGDDSP